VESKLLHIRPVRVRLLRKLANRLDGVDVSACAVGDVLEVSPAQAQLLIAEGWAVRDPASERRQQERRAEDRGDLEVAAMQAKPQPE
jgi:hypothetical protein